MKKILTLLCIILCMSLAACGSNGETTMDNGNDTDGMNGEPSPVASEAANMKDKAEKMVNDAANDTKKAADDVMDKVKN